MRFTKNLCGPATAAGRSSRQCPHTGNSNTGSLSTPAFCWSGFTRARPVPELMSLAQRPSTGQGVGNAFCPAGVRVTRDVRPESEDIGQQVWRQHVLRAALSGHLTLGRGSDNRQVEGVASGLTHSRPSTNRREAEPHMKSSTFHAPGGRL